MIRTTLTVLLAIGLTASDAWCGALCDDPSIETRAGVNHIGGGFGDVVDSAARPAREPSHAMPCHSATGSGDAAPGTTSRSTSDPDSPRGCGDDCDGCEASAATGPSPTAPVAPASPIATALPTAAPRSDPTRASTAAIRQWTDRAPPRDVLARTTTLLL